MEVRDELVNYIPLKYKLSIAKFSQNLINKTMLCSALDIDY